MTKKKFTRKELDDAHRALIEECKHLQDFAKSIKAEALNVGFPIKDAEPRNAEDYEGYPVVFNALYMVTGLNQFLLVRPLEIIGDYSRDFRSPLRVHCSVVFPWRQPNDPSYHNCYATDLCRPDPALLGRQFQTFLDALKAYRHELEHGPPPLPSKPPPPHKAKS